MLNLRLLGVATTRDPLKFGGRAAFESNLRFYVPVASTNPLKFGGERPQGEPGGEAMRVRYRIEQG